MPVAFERAHAIVIDATPAEVLDYVANPNSWPEWIAASHEIVAEDRPLVTGDTFRENWVIRKRCFAPTLRPTCSGMSLAIHLMGSLHARFGND